MMALHGMLVTQRLSARLGPVLNRTRHAAVLAFVVAKHLAFSNAASPGAVMQYVAQPVTSSGVMSHSRQSHSSWRLHARFTGDSARLIAASQTVLRSYQQKSAAVAKFVSGCDAACSSRMVHSYSKPRLLSQSRSLFGSVTRYQSSLRRSHRVVLIRPSQAPSLCNKRNRFFTSCGPDRCSIGSTLPATAKSSLTSSLRCSAEATSSSGPSFLGHKALSCFLLRPHRLPAGQQAFGQHRHRLRVRASTQPGTAFRRLIGRKQPAGLPPRTPVETDGKGQLSEAVQQSKPRGSPLIPRQGSEQPSRPFQPVADESASKGQNDVKSCRSCGGRGFLTVEEVCALLCNHIAL